MKKRNMSHCTAMYYTKQNFQQKPHCIHLITGNHDIWLDAIVAREATRAEEGDGVNVCEALAVECVAISVRVC